ncbi:hypothetical protein E3N88_44917 [Mikania micrantha]|uniref:Uncharacterized protein n=1 Tax=Mikania micrantha TaxID=192012 RepID=A0A5N6LAQ5_9ASTR|nr:hypothetical protein E3N88_44917 [Mikania micrantha]
MEMALVTEAYNMVQNIQIQCNTIVLRTQLAGCYMHGNIKLAEMSSRERPRSEEELNEQKAKNEKYKEGAKATNKDSDGFTIKAAKKSIYKGKRVENQTNQVWSKKNIDGRKNGTIGDARMIKEITSSSPGIQRKMSELHRNSIANKKGKTFTAGTNLKTHQSQPMLSKPARHKQGAYKERAGHDSTHPDPHNITLTNTFSILDQEDVSVLDLEASIQKGTLESLAISVVPILCESWSGVGVYWCELKVGLKGLILSFVSLYIPVVVRVLNAGRDRYMGLGIFVGSSMAGCGCLLNGPDLKVDQWFY